MSAQMQTGAARSTMLISMYIVLHIAPWLMQMADTTSIVLCEFEKPVKGKHKLQSYTYPTSLDSLVTLGVAEKAGGKGVSPALLLLLPCVQLIWRLRSMTPKDISPRDNEGNISVQIPQF